MGLKWEVEGDHPSAFFFWTENPEERRAKRAIESLLDKSETVKTDQKEMKQVVEGILGGLCLTRTR